MIGQTVSHYRIVEKLGEGGMGAVYRAEDTKLGRIVALKFLSEKSSPGAEDRGRFMHEARAAAALNHPNICTIHEIDEHEGRPFIVMEFVEGRSLASLISDGPLKLREAMAIAMQVAEGLNEAHERGIVHRDIKPANIMIAAGARAKIMDFGLAAANDQTRLTREGTTLGTIAYMSPEQARGESIDRRSDIWSLGAVLYEMITGRRPFKGEYDQAVIFQILNEEPEQPTALRTGVPSELERIVLKAMAKRTDERYQHADDMLGDLRKLERALSAGETAARAASTSRGPRQGGVGPMAELPSGTAPEGRLKHGRWIAAVCIAAAAIAGFVILKPVVLERELIASPKPIAVIGFENMTGDSSYDYLSRAIPNLLITSLEQSKYLRVTTWERMRDLLQQMGKDDATSIDKELGFALCRLDGIDVIVTGSFVKAGNTFATDVKVLDVRTKELLKSASARGDGVESILRSQVDELSKEIARGVGLSSRRVDEARRPVAEVTTSSMEAYNYYLRGVDDGNKFYFTDARRLLEKAVEVDSTFAMAYLHLAITCDRLNDFASSKEAYERAMRHAERATQRERMYIEAGYASDREEDSEKSSRILQRLVREYPKEKTAYFWLGTQALWRRQYDVAIANLEKVLSLDPMEAPALNQLAYVHIKTGEYDRALEYLERYAAASPGDANPLDSMGELYFRMGELDRSIATYRISLDP
jgi:tetratricopeptide (TPR) repeat protein/predicted Ser/Thr protein kinase